MGILFQFFINFLWWNIRYVLIALWLLHSSYSYFCLFNIWLEVDYLNEKWVNLTLNILSQYILLLYMKNDYTTISKLFYYYFHWLELNYYQMKSVQIIRHSRFWAGRLECIEGVVGQAHWETLMKELPTLLSHDSEEKKTCSNTDYHCKYKKNMKTIV